MGTLVIFRIFTCFVIFVIFFFWFWALCYFSGLSAQVSLGLGLGLLKCLTLLRNPYLVDFISHRHPSSLKAPFEGE
jgi:hypothetical protein